MDRIISKGKEREREDPRRDSSKTSKTSFQFEYSVSTCNPVATTTSLFPHLILHTELILLQEIQELQGSSRADS